MGGFIWSGRAWRLKTPKKSALYGDGVANNFLEFLAMVVTIWLVKIECDQKGLKQECILGLGDNTSVICWLFKTKGIKKETLYHDAVTFVEPGLDGNPRRAPIQSPTTTMTTRRKLASPSYWLSTTQQQQQHWNPWTARRRWIIVSRSIHPCPCPRPWTARRKWPDNESSLSLSLCPSPSMDTSSDEMV